MKGLETMTMRSDQGRTLEFLEAVRPYTNRHRAEQHKFRPDNAALIVIDMQRYFLDKSSHAYLPDSEHMIGNVLNLLSSSRERSLPILFTRHAHKRGEDLGNMGNWWGDVIREGTEMSELDDRFAPLPRERVFRKTQYSAFVGTGLEKWLRARGVSQLLVTGVMTHLCCETTARDAFMRGFEVFFVVDGTASKALDLHLSSIKTLTDGFAIPVSTKEVLKWMRK